MNYFKINGISYDVIVTSIEETFNILYSENSGRTMADGAPIILTPLGTFFGHKVTVKRKQGYERDYDKLYKIVSTPRFVSDPERDGLEIEIVHYQDTLKYRAYVSNGGRKLKRIDSNANKVYWDELQLNIVPILAQVLP